MAGRIHEDDIALVRERSRIDDVVGQFVTLRAAGGGSLKGLCPFHDEKTPSFHVTTARGFFHCFGCGEGGDVITFVQKINNLSFTEAVQFLADRAGVQLRITDDGRPVTEPGLRVRILEANAAAAEFFAAQLASPDGLPGRQFLSGRGFDRDAAEKFGVGFAPRGGRDLHAHLTGRGFRDDLLVKAGLIRDGGGWDFFQGRVIWPIRDSGSAVLGFGARRIFDDDRMPAKYLNTPETPVYKKSTVLYGLDLARQAIGRTQQAVVMEGYTDVMAAHLSGVETAVASCGTAFGDDHGRLLRRLMGGDAFHGEVVFTFDGDAAGQKAALKVYGGDQAFAAQTYVAVEPSGLDPCDLRLQQGEAAVRELVGRRIPLYRFVMANTVSGFDLDRADGRLAALRAAAPLVASIRDSSLVGGYCRELAQVIGLEMDEVRAEVSRVGRRAVRDEPAVRPQAQPVTAEDEGPALVSSVPMPDPAERSLLVERGTCTLMLQAPRTFDEAWNGVAPEDFSHPAYRAVCAACLAVEYDGDARWAERVRESCEDDQVAQLVVELLVEELPRTPDEAYTAAYTARLQLLRVSYDIRTLKSRLQRTNPVENTTSYNQMFSTLLELESRRKSLQVASLGEGD